MELRGVRHVVGAFDGALGAFAVLVGDLFDDVLDPHVEEQRPLAVLADLDQPRLERVVLLVGHLVPPDGVVDGGDDLGGELVDAFRRGVGGELLPAELLGGGVAGAGGGGSELFGHGQHSCVRFVVRCQSWR